MTDEIMEYAIKRIQENGIRIVRLPKFECREDVDMLIKLSTHLSQKGVEAKRGRMPSMTNKEVSAIFTDIYNGFWMKHRDHIPERSDEAGWDAIMKESKMLMEKYNCQLARDLVANLVVIMDQRMRGGSVGGSS